MKAYSGSRFRVLLYLFSVLDGGRWSQPRPNRSTPRNDPVPTVQEAGWAPGLVWMGAENLAPTEIRPPDRPACSESRQTTQDILIFVCKQHCSAVSNLVTESTMLQLIQMFIFYVRAGSIPTQTYR